MTPRSSLLMLVPAPPDTNTLSLHDALPISRASSLGRRSSSPNPSARFVSSIWRASSSSGVPMNDARHMEDTNLALGFGRSEEHTSELQSRRDLVCRLLLEKKNKQNAPKVYR